jgi:hypothetical protein
MPQKGRFQAYYALFHLLISEATLNWGRPELRSELGRVFGHGKMKSASMEKRDGLDAHSKKNPLASQEMAVFKHLRTVATEVLKQIVAVAVAFKSWQAIREEPAAQAYLVSPGQEVTARLTSDSQALHARLIGPFVAEHRAPSEAVKNCRLWRIKFFPL